MDHTNLVYLSLGGNIGNTCAILATALEMIQHLPDVDNFKSSHLYRTSPVDAPFQEDYINAACSLQTSLDIHSFWVKLQEIERLLGKTTKAKNAPRIIDIDIIVFGQESHCNREIEIPHPRWQQRLFVLVPLKELTDNIIIPREDRKGVKSLNIQSMIDSFPHDSCQNVCLLEKKDLSNTMSCS